MERDAVLLAPFLTPGRLERLERALARRTRWITVVLDDIYHSHNMSAVVRSCEAMGIQEIHSIEISNPFDPSHGVAMGAQQWITIHRHSSVKGCYEWLEAKGYRILCADPPSHLQEGKSESSDVFTPEEIPLERPVALVFGRERDGLHQEAREMSHGAFYIPMRGLTESLNVSVTAGIAIYVLRKRLEAELERSVWALDRETRLDLLDSGPSNR